MSQTRTLRRCASCNMFVPADQSVCPFCQSTEFVMIEEAVPSRQRPPVTRPNVSYTAPAPTDGPWLTAAIIAGLIMGVLVFLSLKDTSDAAWLYGLLVGLAVLGNVWIVGMISITKRHAERNGQILESIERKVSQ